MHPACLQSAHETGGCVRAGRRGGGVVPGAGAVAAGPVGGAAAPDCAWAAPPREDVRAYALNAGSVELLRELKVWEALPADARCAVYDMHVEGDAAGSALDFSAWSQGVEALAWIVDAAELERALATAVSFAPHVQCVGERAGGGDAAGAGRRQGLGHARAARRGDAGAALRPERGGRAAADRRGARRRGAAVVPLARRAGAAALRPARAGAGLRAGVVGAAGARRRTDGAGRQRPSSRRWPMPPAARRARCACAASVPPGR